MKTEYDKFIKQYAEEYLPYDWLLFKAQLFKESSLNPDAVSHAGAKGLAQFMPGTWNDMIKQISLPSTDPFDPESSIKAGAYYMRKLHDKWTSPRPDEDRIKLALASYNAGFGNILKAQKVSGDKNLYNDIASHLHEVTGDHSKETLFYTKKIFELYNHLKA